MVKRGPGYKMIQRVLETLGDRLIFCQTRFTSYRFRFRGRLLMKMLRGKQTSPNSVIEDLVLIIDAYLSGSYKFTTFTTYFFTPSYYNFLTPSNTQLHEDMEKPSNSLAQNTILILLLLYTPSSLAFISALPKTNVEFIKSSCSLTTYPTLCVNSLSTRAGAIQTLSPKLLAQTALSVTLDTTRSTSTAIVKLSQMHGMAPIEIAALKDCVELLSDSVYELKRSLEEMSRPGSKSTRLVMSDLKTWVSAAMTDEDTCIEGFMNTKLKNVVRGKIVNVAHLTSNALALINSYASLSKQRENY